MARANRLRRSWRHLRHHRRARPGLALGAAGGSETNEQGALGLIAQASLGKLALNVVAIGLLAYALWKFTLSAIEPAPK